MTSEDREIRPLSERLIQQQPVLLPGDVEEDILVLCVSEDVSVAERDLIPTMKRAGLQVDLVEANLQEPLDLCSKPYQLVLFDITAPNGLGYKVCERTRNACNVSVMLVLHGAARHDVLRGYQIGADAYILAPFDDREFLARLGALLRRRPARWRTI
ncbi:MAG: hypothetical protein CVU38_15115 [Chloroflexi bacterium HGW-Chloroflexi-1]|nr:MAG: hypothetical protein CVU38_15115 [Chloroflexi bacterium HGW-Chloroflexi-1]